MFPTLILTTLVLGLAIAGIGIKMFFSKEGRFSGGCASNNPMLKNEIGECTVCGSKPGDPCANPEAEKA